jgi:hypothetical protein
MAASACKFGVSTSRPYAESACFPFSGICPENHLASWVDYCRSGADDLDPRGSRRTLRDFVDPRDATAANIEAQIQAGDVFSNVWHQGAADLLSRMTGAKRESQQVEQSIGQRLAVVKKALGPK